MKIDFGEPIDFEIPVANSPVRSSLARHAKIDVFVLKSAHDEMIEHVNADKNIECGGVLVGYPFQDPNNEKVFVIIVGVIRDLSDNRSLVHFTVTPDVISKTRKILEEKYPELIAVGWYHSHPGHGVFLSGQDMTIVKGIYNEEWNLAWVIDPIREQEGVFYGADGEPLVKNKSSNPLFVKDKQTWFALDEYPQCVKDVQSGMMKFEKNKVDSWRTHEQPMRKKGDQLVSKREEKESREISKGIRYLFVGLGVVSIILFVVGAIVLLYFNMPIVNPTATPLILPTINSPIPPITPSIEWTITPAPSATIPVVPAYP